MCLDKFLHKRRLYFINLNYEISCSRLKVYYNFFFIFQFETGYSQNYSNSINPNDLASFQDELNPIIWGCRYCAKPLKQNVKLTWEISYMDGTIESENLVDSLILDFSQTPGFSLDNIKISNNNLIRLSPTKLLVLKGKSRIYGLKQIDINKVDSRLYQHRIKEINAVSVEMGNKKLFPIHAKINIISKEVKQDSKYSDLNFKVIQYSEDKPVGSYYLKTDIIEFSNPIFNQNYSNTDYNNLSTLIGDIPNTSSPSCTLQKIRPRTIRLPFINFEIEILPVPRPNLSYSLICIEADRSLAQFIPPPFFSREVPTLVFDGRRIGSDEIISDRRVYPFHSFPSSVSGKEIYLYSIPNIRSGNGINEFFIYHKKNQLCHIPFNYNLNGSYFIKLKERYKPDIQFYAVNGPNDGTWLNRIRSNLGAAACFYDAVPTGIDLRESLIKLNQTQNLNTVPSNLLERNIRTLIDSFIEYPSTKYALPKSVDTIKNSGFFDPDLINVYYVNRQSGTFNGLYAYPNIIIINQARNTSETLAHELGHSFGIKHVFEELVLDCNRDGIGDAHSTRNANLMHNRITTTSRTKFTFGQIIRMNYNLYSAIRNNGMNNTTDCRVCDENPNSAFYRTDEKCPCLGLDN